MNRRRFRQKNGHRSNPSFDAAIYPTNFALPGTQSADILVTHEVQGCHPFGFQTLFLSTSQDLARSKARRAACANGLIVRRGEALGISTPAGRALWAGVELIECKAISEALDTSLSR